MLGNTDNICFTGTEASIYYKEITKIIEAGMRKKTVKVGVYSRLLAAKLSGDGEECASFGILSAHDNHFMNNNT